MKLLVCNAGSTSLKFKLYIMPEGIAAAQCRIERVGSRGDAVLHYRRENGPELTEDRLDIPTYAEGIRRFLSLLTSAAHGVIAGAGEIERVGFKTTCSKGFGGTQELTPAVLQGMRDWLPIAPVHNAAYLSAAETLRDFLPEAMFVGVFETAFHRTVPEARRVFGVPYAWRERYGVERLGYHGASHGYIADVLNGRAQGRPYRAISCHLGGSSSVCAIENGRSVDTSFGMSLQSGLIQSTRTGDIDYEIVDLLRAEGLSGEEIRRGLEEEGGLLGISGVSADLRYIGEAAAAGNRRAQLAIDAYVAGIVHFIGAFFLDLGGLDDLVFTAGIGENSADIRQRVCERLAPIGVVLDGEKNRTARGAADLTGAGSKTAVLVIPTDEEAGIARRTFEYGKDL